MRKFLFATALSVTLETGCCALSSAETWNCVEAKVIIDLDQRRVELIVPSLSYDVLIVDGARGPLGGKCPVVCGNSLVPFEQFVDFIDDSVRFGFRAIGPVGVRLQATHPGAAYVSYTLLRNGRLTGRLTAITGDGDRKSEFCRK